MILQVLSYRNQPSPIALVGRYAQEGGTLGRSPDNALVLEDPSKYISRVHARIAFRDGGYFIEDLGSNPSIVNERPHRYPAESCQEHLRRISTARHRVQPSI